MYIAGPLISLICHAGPNFTPSVRATASTSYTGLTFSWNEIACELQNGSGFHYQYTFQTENGTTRRTSVSFGNLTACTEYNFKVWAVNDVGQGPVSSKSATTRTIGKMHFYLKER